MKVAEISGGVPATLRVKSTGGPFSPVPRREDEVALVRSGDQTLLRHGADVWSVDGVTPSDTTQLTDVVVSDTMISPDSTTCAVLQPGETCALTGTYTVAIADLQAGSVVNTATADSTETNPVTGPVTASVTTPVVVTPWFME